MASHEIRLKLFGRADGVVAGLKEAAATLGDLAGEGTALGNKIGERIRALEASVGGIRAVEKVEPSGPES